MTKQACGAKNRQGTPCKLPAGWGVPGNPGRGRCKLHGGRSTGPRTEAGRQKSAESSRTHGLYAKILTDEAKVRYELVQELAPAEILKSNFFLLQSKLSGILENDVRHHREARILLQAADLLVEQGELSADFVAELRLKLANFDVDRLARTMNSTTHLISVATYLDRLGKVDKQLGMFKRFWVDVLKTSTEREVRVLAVQLMAELKLEADIPTAELEALIQQSQPAHPPQTPAPVDPPSPVSTDDDLWNI